MVIDTWRWVESSGVGRCLKVIVLRSLYRTQIRGGDVELEGGGKKAE
jgi:hypothetical protein